MRIAGEGGEQRLIDLRGFAAGKKRYTTSLKENPKNHLMIP